jgi:hypothetical protein
VIRDHFIARIACSSDNTGGKPVYRRRRLAEGHVPDLLVAGMEGTNRFDAAIREEIG